VFRPFATPQAQQQLAIVDGTVWTGHEAARRAQDLATRWSLRPGGRLLSTLDPHSAHGAIAAGVLPILGSAGAESVVLVSNTEDAPDTGRGEAAARAMSLAQQEAVTCFAR